MHNITSNAQFFCEKINKITPSHCTVKNYGKEFNVRDITE